MPENTPGSREGRQQRTTNSKDCLLASIIIMEAGFMHRSRWISHHCNILGSLLLCTLKYLLMVNQFCFFIGYTRFCCESFACAVHNGSRQNARERYEPAELTSFSQFLDCGENQKSKKPFNVNYHTCMPSLTRFRLLHFKVSSCK